MKMKLYAAAALVSVTALISCAGSNESEYVDKSIIPAGTENKTTQAAEPNATIQTPGTVPANAPLIPGATNQAQPININPNNVVTSSPQTMTTQPAAVAAGMNPAHGQPGHRCDISVGEPLNSKPAPANAQAAVPHPTDPTATAQPKVTMTEVPNTQKTAPGMNPPHGEPGHRCDIAVGAALNSKPAPANTPPTVMNPQTPPAVVSTQTPPAQVTTTDAAPKQKTAPGMNPPHGEAGHRCDIAVGAPLDSKPTTPAATPVQVKTPAPLITPVKKDTGKN